VETIPVFLSGDSIRSSPISSVFFDVDFYFVDGRRVQGIRQSSGDAVASGDVLYTDIAGELETKLRLHGTGHRRFNWLRDTMKISDCT
jgi:hypothetical protein